MLHLAAVERDGGVRSVVPRITNFGSRYTYMNGQLQALADQDLVKEPTEHTGQTAGRTLVAAEGSRELTPPPEIKIPKPRSARP
jgi:hypothetical protein